jgi:hypothetical protein
VKDQSTHRWIKAGALKHGTHLRTPGSASVTTLGGHVPAKAGGWMWDLTVPGGGDHDFYIRVEAASVLVHNCGNEELARNIAGHADIHFSGTTEEAAQTIQDVLDSSDSLSRELANGRTAYYNDGVIVIQNPNVTYGGTAYPGSFDDFLELR